MIGMFVDHHYVYLTPQMLNVVKPPHATTSIKQSLVLIGDLFLVMSYEVPMN